MSRSPEADAVLTAYVLAGLEPECCGVEMPLSFVRRLPAGQALALAAELFVLFGPTGQEGRS